MILYMHLLWKRYATVNAPVVEEISDYKCTFSGKEIWDCMVYPPFVEMSYETVYVPVVEQL